MERKDMTTNKKKALRLGLALLLVALLSIGISLSAKFTQEKVLNGTLTINSDLISDIRVLAHSTEKQPDGTYALTTSDVAQNEYMILPGTDVPADPYVSLVGKTGVPSYLYIEIVDDTPSGVSYTPADGWVPLTGIAGPHGGTVYSYTGLITNESPDTIPVLTNDSISVSENIGSTETSSLAIYPYLAEAGTDTPETAFASVSNGAAYTASFTPYPSSSAIAEITGGEGETMEHINVNVSDCGYSVYLRAAVTINWQNANGDVIFPAPTEEECEAEYGNGWQKGSDGFWYWPEPVASGSTVPDLIVSLTTPANRPDDCGLNVIVTAQTIQSAGFTDADNVPLVTSAWGCVVNADATIAK